MHNKQEIKQEIWKIWQTFTLAKECFGYAHYLYNPETKAEREYMDYSPDFAFIRHILWRTVIIELAKLVREPMPNVPYIFNITSFVNKFKDGGEYSEIGVNGSMIKKWEGIIQNNKENADKVLIIWSKVYALSDSENTKYLNNDISFEEIEKLMLDFENIIKELYAILFKLEKLENPPLFSKKRFKLLKTLANVK